MRQRHERMLAVNCQICLFGIMCKGGASGLQAGCYREREGTKMFRESKKQIAQIVFAVAFNLFKLIYVAF